jgi:hypothetical protein
MNAKVFGIIALVLSIISIFIPILGVYLTFLIALLAIFSAGDGFSLGASSIGLNIMNLFFFSPGLWITVAGESSRNDLLTQAGYASQATSSAMGLGIFFIVSQLVAAIILYMRQRKFKNRILEAPVA